MPFRRVAATLGVSLAFHVALVALGSFPLGFLLDTIAGDTDPLIVEVVVADSQAPTRAAPTSVPGRQSRMPAATVALPPVLPVVGEEVSPPVEPHPAAEMAPSTGVALETDIPRDTSEDPALGQATDESSSAPLASNGIAQSAGPDASAGRGTAGDDQPQATPDQVAGADDPTRQAAVSDRRVSSRRLDAVTRNPSVSARTAGEPFVGRRDVFEFLLDHPDFATHVTRVLRLARYRMWRTDEGLFVDDGWGATGQVFVVHATSGSRVLYAKGEFQNGFLPAIPGEAVVTINYDARPTGDGRDLLVADISSQLKIDGAFGSLLVRLANSLATEKAEKESQRLMRVFARVLRAIEEKPAALYASLLERPDVPQRELEQFRILLKLP